VTLDPHQIDWSTMTRTEMNNIRMVQAPGDHNALGQVRVLMPNDYDIYMHDTNHKEFFDRTQRTYSSGCIRLSEPKKVAEFVMHKNKRWTDKKLAYYIDRGKLADVPVDEPFPVFILYQTVWLNDDGKLVFGSDIYGEDKRLVAALAKSKGYYLPPKSDEEKSNEVTGSADAAMVPTLVSAH
jgi:murein L,D-transpeptidase YcbB/YkuD